MSPKHKSMRSHLAALGISPAISVPPLYVVLWRLGIPLTPRLFAMPASLLAFSGLLGCALWVLFLAPTTFKASLPVWLRWDLLPLQVGVLIGAGVTLYYRHLARRLALSSLAAYRGE